MSIASLHCAARSNVGPEQQGAQGFPMAECTVATSASEAMFLPSFDEVLVYSLDGSHQRRERAGSRWFTPVQDWP